MENGPYMDDLPVFFYEHRWFSTSLWSINHQNGKSIAMSLLILHFHLIFLTYPLVN